MYSKYTDYSTTIPANNINLPFSIGATLHSNKNLKPMKIYTTDLSVSKKWKSFIFKTTLFYNRITDAIVQDGFMKFAIPPHIDFYNLNFIDYAIHGFESYIQYQPDKHFNLFASYMLQHLKNKTANINKDYYLPKYKIAGGVLFDFKKLSGSLTTNYIPAIKAYPEGTSDYVLSVNANVMKKFFDDKLEISLHGENL
jgi:outer membrane receptor protein involved in Fe transport